MNEQERIDYLILALASDNARVFAEKCDINKTSLSKLRNGRFHIPKFADRILNAYPQVNPDWLLYGKGEPMVAPASVSRMMAKMEQMDEKLDRLINLFGTLMKQA